MNTILVVGGTSGIGEAFTKRFHSMGKQVIVTGRRKDRLTEMQKTLPSLEVYPFDMTDLPSVPNHVEKLFTSYPNIDTVWINGGLQYLSSIKDINSTTDDKVIEEVTTNVTAPMILARHVIPRLLAQKMETQFMITSSGLGFVPVGSMFPIYCPTKAAIHDYLVGIRQALKDTNVNVIEIVPPFVGGTELGSEHKDKVANLTPLPIDDFVKEIFEVLDNNKASELKEVAAGTAVNRVRAWRSGIGEILVKSGLGG